MTFQKEVQSVLSLLKITKGGFKFEARDLEVMTKEDLVKYKKENMNLIEEQKKDLYDKVNNLIMQATTVNKIFQPVDNSKQLSKVNQYTQTLKMFSSSFQSLKMELVQNELK